MLLTALISEAQTSMEWPDLKNYKFTSGRSATEEDINAGAAVFLLQSHDGEPIGVPIEMVLPQYAYHHDGEGNTDMVILIQAEEANNQKTIGAINIVDSTYLAALLFEFTLLGETKPSE